MKKRVLSWLLTLSLVLSLVPPIPVRAAQSSAEITGWPSTEDLTNAVLTTTITNDVTPTSSITVKSGKTLIVKGTGALRSSSSNKPLFIVESGGHLVLDDVTITDNAVGTEGAVYVKKGGLLDLGYNDQSIRHAPGISGNTSGGTARNLVIEDGATVRLNAEVKKAIGITSGGTVNAPVSVIQGGRYSIQDSDIGNNAISSDDANLKLLLKYDQIVLRQSKTQILYWYPTQYFNYKNSAGKTYPHLGQHKNVLDEISNVQITDAMGTPTSPKRLDSQFGSDGLGKFDLVFIVAPWGDMTETEQTILTEYLKSGGTIFVQAEDANPQNGFTQMNAYASKWAQTLGAGFIIMNSPQIPSQAPIIRGNKWTNGISLKDWLVNQASPIVANQGVEFTSIFSSAVKEKEYDWCVNLLAGKRDDGSTWGNIILSTDANMWTTQFDGNFSNWGYKGGQTKKFAQNLVEISLENRVSAATGYNPNSDFNKW